MEGRDGTKICPECAEEVKAAAHVCRFCGYRFDPSQPPQAPPQRDVRESLLKPLWFRVLIVLSTLAIAAAAIILIALRPWEPADGKGDSASRRADDLDARQPPQEPAEQPPAGPSDEETIEREMNRLMKDELESAIARDARKNVRADLLDGPIRGAQCTYSGRGPGETRKYDCIAITKKSGSMAEGYEYQATANSKNGEMSWELGD